MSGYLGGSILLGLQVFVARWHTTSRIHLLLLTLMLIFLSQDFLLLGDHDLLNLLLHLQDGVHHGHFGRRRFLLLYYQGFLDQVKLLLQEIILMNQHRARSLIIVALFDVTRLIYKFLYGRVQFISALLVFRLR